MDLRLLRYFLVVADELHITRAAARLGIQQAPLSQQIKGLERTLGAQLFKRKPRGVELTEAGAALRKEAAAILASVDRAVDTTRRVARGEQGQIRVGLTTSACFHPFPPQAIRSFLEADDFEQAIRLAISLGGDSDTLACMAGGIAQAFFGGVPGAIAHRVFELLDDHLGALTREFLEAYGCP